MEDPKDTSLIVPSWAAAAAQFQDPSADALKERQVIARLKVNQALTSKKFKDKVGDGGVLVLPTMRPIANLGEPFKVVPVFYFTTYEKLADLKDPEGRILIERSFDPQGTLAKKCQNHKLWVESYGEGSKYNYRHSEVHNFVCQIYDKDVPSNGDGFVISFRRGEFAQGKYWAQLAGSAMYNGSRIPLFGQIFQLSSALREKKGNKWYGLDVEFVEYVQSVEDMQKFQAFALELKEAMYKKILDLTDDEDRGEDRDEDAEISAFSAFA